MMQGPLDIGRFLDSSHFSSIFSQEEIEGSKERVTPAMAVCLREKKNMFVTGVVLASLFDDSSMFCLVFICMSLPLRLFGTYQRRILKVRIIIYTFAFFILHKSTNMTSYCRCQNLGTSHLSSCKKIISEPFTEAFWFPGWVWGKRCGTFLNSGPFLETPNTSVWSRGDWTPGWYRPDSASLGCSDLKLISTVKFGRLKPRPCGCSAEASAGAMDAIEYSLEQGNKLGDIWRLNEIDVCFFSSGLLNLHFNQCLPKKKLFF